MWLICLFTFEFFFSTYILEFKNINIKTNFKVGKTKNIKSLQYKHLICHLALASVNQNLGHTSTLNNPNHRHSTTSICTKLTHINMYDHSTCISIVFFKTINVLNVLVKLSKVMATLKFLNRKQS